MRGVVQGRPPPEGLPRPPENFRETPHGEEFEPCKIEYDSHSLSRLSANEVEESSRFSEAVDHQDSCTRAVQRVWGGWGEYTLDPQFRVWALREMGFGGVDIAIDLFAEPWSATAPLYISQKMDAFGYSWGKLTAEADGLLWANPPFRFLGRVAQKVLQEACRVALCTPEWTQEEWWGTLQGIPHQRIQLPVRRRLFFARHL